MNGDIRLDKNKGRLKIDGVFSVIDAMAAVNSREVVEPSGYEIPGALSL